MSWANPPKVELAAPFRVSPFIRFCRWSGLLLGIAYGIHHNRVLKKKEAEHRVNLRQQKVIWDENMRIKKIQDNRDEMLYLAKETNTKIPANFDEMYPLIK